MNANNYVSYFIGLDADETRPQTILSGDYNVDTAANASIFSGTASVNGATAVQVQSGNAAQLLVSPGFCDAGTAGTATATTITQMSLIARNAQQDYDLFRAATARKSRDEVIKGLPAALDAADAAAWCADRPRAYNPEVFLRARDVLIRAAITAPE